MSGGQPAIRGYLVQTLIGLLEVLDGKRPWTSVTLEPNVESKKVDILWQYPHSTKAVQVKSSQNPFSKADLERWAGELESWREADKYELVLVGMPGSPAVARIKRIGKVAVPPPKPLDLPAFKHQAAHLLERFLESQRLPVGKSGQREMLAGALAECLATLSTKGDPLTPDALVDLIERWTAQTGVTPPALPADPTAYLHDLGAKTRFIDIRGLHVGKGRAYRFEIEELFISLTTTEAATRAHEEAGPPRRKRRPADVEDKLGLAQGRNVPLHAALRNDRLVVVGDPGAGKTTFLRRVAHTLCQTHLGDVPDAARERLGIADRTFPIFVRLSELAQHLVRCGSDSTAPAGEDAPAWLIHYLASASQANHWGLGAPFFRQQLEEGLATVLLDGLDEAPDRTARERLSRLIENAAGAYRGCRFVVTSRPAGYVGEVILPEFAHAGIDPLSDQAVETFLGRWCESLYAESPNLAREHCDELLHALRARPEIRRMARNPVMLTALAVVQWNERRLPEQRADLYESIIRWLSRSREQRPGRPKAERTVVWLQEVALAMQDHPEGMRTEVPRRWAADLLADQWASGPADKDDIARADEFLGAEELDSGIIVGRGDNVQFWHRTFQEFLAARAIAARPDAQQERLLWGPPPKLYLPEWREVVLLLVGILHQHGPAKVEHLVGTILSRLGPNPSLADQARSAGLLGAMMRDLAPVDYEPPGVQYHDLLNQVMAIFDAQGSQTVPLETRIAAADALGQAGDPRIDPQRDDYWATIPAGKFLMGAQSNDAKGPNYDKEAYEDESPVHEVHLDAYRIARYPVTVGQYREFVEDEGYEEERWWTAGGFGQFSQPDEWDDQLQYPSRPVVSVSWYEAAAFCAWAGFRLPTEAEWERAGRGVDGRLYPWGDDPPEPSRLDYDDSAIGHPTPVGIYPLGATPDGICDMAGNVDEWCADWYAHYTRHSVSNPRGAKEGQSRVLRGGSWDFYAQDVRSAYRYDSEPGSRDHDIGFRCARVPSGK